MKTKKTDAKKSTKPTEKREGAFDYGALKNTANECEREGRWLDAAQAWTTIADQSKNPMVVKMARQRVDAAKRNARENDDTHATGDAATPPGAPTANDAPVAEAAPTALPPANDANVGEPAANDTQPDDAAAPTPKPRDARLPEVGTIIQKRDRKGQLRCECKVVADGIEYKGATYKSLSSAALAASKDLGLGASTLDGWSWWGLKTRPVVPGTKKDLVASLERAFAKFRDKATAVAQAASEEDRAKVLGAIRSQGAALLAMTEPTESAQ